MFVKAASTRASYGDEQAREVYIYGRKIRILDQPSTQLNDLLAPAWPKVYPMAKTPETGIELTSLCKYGATVRNFGDGEGKIFGLVRICRPFLRWTAD